MSYNNLLLHIPHTSLHLPQDFWRDIIVDQKTIEQNVRFMADYKVDKLVENIDCRKVAARYSRLYCDVERFREDVDEPMAKLGMGAVYTHLPGGVRYRNMTPSRREAILKKAYEPHHAQLSALSREIVAEHGSCMVIDLHSYSDELVQKLFGWTENLPDICLGYDDEWFDQKDAVKLKKYIESLGYSCALNYPYSGALVPTDFYHNKMYSLRSMMLEINRRVYLEKDIVRENAIHDMSRIISFLAENI